MGCFGSIEILEEMSMAKQEYSATESVRKLLEDNSKALDVLDTLEEKKQAVSKIKKTYTYYAPGCSG